MFETVVQGLHVRGSWRSNMTAIFWPHCYDRHVVSFLFSRAAQPEAKGPLCWMLAFLLHLISIFSGPQTPSGFPRAPSVGCGLSLPHLVSNWPELYWQPYWPLGVELNWNRNSIHQGPNGPFGLMWLSLTHLVYLRPISNSRLVELNWVI